MQTEQLKTVKSEAAKNRNQSEKKKERMIDERELLQKIENFVDGLTLKTLIVKNKLQVSLLRGCSKLKTKFQSMVKKQIIEKKVELLKSAPCSYKLQEKCHFVSDARYAIDDTNRVKIALNQLSLNKGTVAKKLDEMNVEKLDEYSSKYLLLQERGVAIRNEVSNLKIDIER